MKSDIIAFKGVKDGLYLEVKNPDIDLIKRALYETMKKSLEFFHGAKFLGVKGEELSRELVLELNLILKYKYDFEISLEDLWETMENTFVKDTEEPEILEIIDELVADEMVDEGMTKFVYGTLRSGQAVEYEGNIVVVGDVNPGAFLKATGNIIVLGTLRGLAHGGSNGNSKAIVAAYNLLANQLRIADIIVRAPDGDVSQYKLPEVAKIYKGEVIIEPYLPNK